MIWSRAHASLLAGVAVLGAAGLLVSREFRPVAAASAPSVHKTPKLPTREIAKSSRPPGGLPPERLAALPVPVTSPYPEQSAAYPEWIATRVSQLNDLAWFDDAQSLRRILAELRNPLPDIQAAALAATLAFGSREAIPYLEALAADSPDPKTRQDLREAATFLKRPTLLESH